MGSKRSYDYLEPLDRGSYLNGKRSRLGTPTSTPGTTTPGSSESLGFSQESEGISGPFLINTSRNAAIQRQLLAEQNATQRASQAQWDEALARSLASNSLSLPNLPSSLSQSVLNSDLTVRRPLTLARASSQPQFRTPVHNPHAGPSITPGPSNTVRSPFADLVPLPQLFDQSSIQVPATTSFARPNSFQIPNQEMNFTFDFAQPLPDVNQNTRGISSGASGQNRDSDSPDSDSDIVEITAAEFTPRVHNSFQSPNSAHQHMGPPMVNLSQPIPPMQNLVNHFGPGTSNQQMPGAWPNPIPRLPVCPWLPAEQGTNQYGMGLGHSVNTSVTSYPSLNQYGSMLNSGYSAALNSGAYPSSVPPPGPNYDHNLDYLYADPKKSAEEIAKLLENIRPDEDLPPHLREGTPDAMRFPLLEHQKLGLAWLKQQEEGSNKAGILADDMGLGKTIQALALMVTRKSDDVNCKTTLIIAPVALMRQWELEIQEKIKPGHHALSVYKHHGAAKRRFDYLRRFDVVITTFGSLAAELKRKENWQKVLAENPNALPTAKEELSLIGSNCKWYRVIIDEAQCIKNKDTQSAKAVYLLNAQYRLCMTGTPMMNNVTELFSLIHFCRIKPFNSWTLWRHQIQNPILKDRNGQSRENAMKKLQGLIRATMLRRTKESKIDGQPIIQLPPRETGFSHVTFSNDEQAYYTALETKVQLQFNKYLKAGTVMRNYANALVLLLRLRQACCHPHLILNSDLSPLAELKPETMEKLAKTLSPQVIAMIRDAGGNFVCPICLDTAPNPAIFIPCGHDTCSECFSRLTDPSGAIAAGSDANSEAKCPECRGKVNPRKIIDYNSFKRVHQQELLDEEEKAKLEDDSETEDEDESDSDTDGEESEDETESLNGFIVDDDDDTLNDNEIPKMMRKKKNKRKSKGKGKVKDEDTKKSLALLKREGMRNKKARRKYFARLRRDFVSSSKIDQTLELLKKIHEKEPVEKVLIFSQFTSLLDLLEIPISDANYDYRRYDGSMSPNERTEAALEFKMTPTCTIMLVSLKAGNAGLNLNCASQVIILDPFWNPFIEEQAIDRAHRIGQMRAVQVHRVLVPGTVEDRIIQMQEKKRELISEALDENAGKNISRLGVRELAFLFGVRTNPH